MRTMIEYILITSILGAVNEQISIAPIMGAIIRIAPTRHEIGRNHYKKHFCYLGAIPRSFHKNKDNLISVPNDDHTGGL